MFGNVQIQHVMCTVSKWTHINGMCRVSVLTQYVRSVIEVLSQLFCQTMDGYYFAMCWVYSVCGNGNSKDTEFPFLSNFIKRTKPSEYTAIGII